MFTNAIKRNLCFAIVTFYICITLFSGCSAASTKHPEKTENGNKTSGIDSSLQDRMNFNREHAHAAATNEDGSSSAQHDSYAGQAGILHPDGSYDSLYTDAHSSGDASSSGSNAPQTWANTNSQVEPGQSSGSGEAGLSGGEGTAYESSYSTSDEIPLGESGSVLYSNLKRKHHNSTRNGTSSVTKLHNNSTRNETSLTNLHNNNTKNGTASSTKLSKLPLQKHSNQSQPLDKETLKSAGDAIIFENESAANKTKTTKRAMQSMEDK